MKILFRSQLVISTSTGWSRVAAQAALLLSRATVVALFIFYSAFSPAPSLGSMRFNAGDFLLGLGRLLGAPLYCLTSIFAELGAFLRTGLPLDMSLQVPSARYLGVTIPIYFALLALALPITRRLKACDASAQRLSRRFQSGFIAGMVGMAARIAVWLVPASLAIRYAFTPQYSDTWGGLGGGNLLWYAKGAGQAFKYLALLPAVPLAWLNERGSHAFEPPLVTVILNAVLVSILAAFISTIVHRLRREAARRQGSCNGA